MVNDIVCGHFKGFALLRQLTQRSGQHTVQPQPVYVEGYGFVPLSQVCSCCFYGEDDGCTFTPTNLSTRQFCGDDAGAIPTPNLQDTLSPSDMLLMAAQQKYSLRSQSLPAAPTKSPTGMGQASVGFDPDQLQSLAQELNNPFLTAATLNAAAGMVLFGVGCPHVDCAAHIE